MCTTFQLADDDDIEEIHRITRDIDAKYGEGTAKAYLSDDFFPRQNCAVTLGGFPMKDSPHVVFNARAENLEKKPMFRPCLQNRCLIPATQFNV